MIASIVNMIYAWIEGMIMVFIPTSLIAKDINDQVVLITGGGSGIGRLLAIKFAAKGCIPVIWDVNEAGMQETAAEVRKRSNQTCHSYVCDVSNRAAVYEAMNRVKSDVGRVDILINNAGIVNGKRLLELNDERMIKLMEINVMSHFWTVKAVLLDMIKSNSGHIVSISSVAGISGGCNMTDYSAAKFGAVGFMESLMYELAADGHDGIKTTIVAPWYINTGLFAGVDTGIIPFLDPEYVASRVLDAVLRNQGVLLLPKLLYVLFFLKSFLPVKAMLQMFKALNGHKQMDTFVGREGSASAVTNGNDLSTKSRVM